MADWRERGYVPDSDDDEEIISNTLRHTTTHDTTESNSSIIPQQQNDANQVRSYTAQTPQEEIETTASATVADQLEAELQHGLETIHEVLGWHSSSFPVNQDEDSPLSSPPSSLDIALQDEPELEHANTRSQQSALVIELPSVTNFTRASPFRTGRALRDRAPIQLHPYALEDARYRQTLQDRGVKPIRVATYAATDVPLANNESLEVDTSFRVDQNQDSLANSQQSSLIIPAEDESQSPIRPLRLQGSFHNSGQDLGVDELPELSDILEGAPLSLTASRISHQKKKPKVYSSKQHIKAKLDRYKVYKLPDEFNKDSYENDLPDEGSMFDIPISPPRSASSTSLPRLSVRRNLMYPNRPDTPRLLPTPVLSSDRRSLKRTTVDIPSSSDESLATDGSSDPALDDFQHHEDESQGVLKVRRKIKGVLPASWLRLDFQKQSATSKPREHNRSPVKTSPNKGVAQKVKSNRKGVDRDLVSSLQDLSSEGDDFNVVNQFQGDDDIRMPDISEDEDWRDQDSRSPAYQVMQRQTKDFRHAVELASTPRTQYQKRQSRIEDTWDLSDRDRIPTRPERKTNAHAKSSTRVKSSGSHHVRKKAKTSSHRHAQTELGRLTKSGDWRTQPTYLRIASRRYRRRQPTLQPSKSLRRAQSTLTGNRANAGKSSSRSRPLSRSLSWSNDYESDDINTEPVENAKNTSRHGDRNGSTQSAFSRDLIALKRSTEFTLSNIRHESTSHEAIDAATGSIDGVVAREPNLRAGGPLSRNNRAGIGHLLARVEVRDAQIEAPRVRQSGLTKKIIKLVPTTTVYTQQTSNLPFREPLQSFLTTNSEHQTHDGLGTKSARPRKRAFMKSKRANRPTHVLEDLRFDAEDHIDPVAQSLQSGSGSSTSYLVKHATQRALELKKLPLALPQLLQKILNSDIKLSECSCLRILDSEPSDLFTPIDESHHGAIDFEGMPMDNYSRHLLATPLSRQTCHCNEYDTAFSAFVSKIFLETKSVIVHDEHDGGLPYGGGHGEELVAKAASCIECLDHLRGFLRDGLKRMDSKEISDLTNNITDGMELIHVAIKGTYKTEKPERKPELLLVFLNRLLILNSCLQGLAIVFQLENDVRTRLAGIHDQLLTTMATFVFNGNKIVALSEEIQRLIAWSITDSDRNEVLSVEAETVLLVQYTTKFGDSDANVDWLEQYINDEFSMHTNHVDNLAHGLLVISTLLSLSGDSQVHVNNVPDKQKSSRGFWHLLVDPFSQFLVQYTKRNRPKSPQIREFGINLFKWTLLVATDWNWTDLGSFLRVLFKAYSDNEMMELFTGQLPTIPHHPHESVIDTNTVSTDETDFDIFLKLTVLALQEIEKIDDDHMRSKALGRNRSLVFSLFPNTSKKLEGDQILHKKDLLSISNCFRLYETLYQYASNDCKPRLGQIEALVNFSHCHIEVSKVVVRAWSCLAQTALKNGQPHGDLDYLAQWIQRMCTQAYEKCKSAQHEVVQALFEKGQTMSAYAEEIIQVNQQTATRQLEGVLNTWREQLERCSDESTVRLLLGKELDKIFDFARAKNGLGESIIEHVCKLCTAYINLSPSARLPNCLNLDIQRQTRLTLSEILSGNRMHSIECLYSVVELWFSIAKSTVKALIRNWDEYLISPSPLSFAILAETEQSRQCQVLFVSKVIEEDQMYLDLERVTLYNFWIQSILQPDHSLRFEHVLTNRIIVSDPIPLALNDLQQKLISLGVPLLSQTELIEHRLEILRHLIRRIYLLQFESDSFSETGLSSHDGQKFLRTICSTLKSTWRSLRGESQNDWTNFIYAVLTELQIYKYPDFVIDTWFTDPQETEFPKRAFRLNDFFICRPGNGEHDLDQAMFVVFRGFNERALAENNQSKWMRELADVFCCTEFDRILDDGYLTINIALQTRFLAVVIPAYIECAADDCTRLLALPLISCFATTCANLSFRIDNYDEHNITQLAVVGAEVLMSISDKFRKSQMRINEEITTIATLFFATVLELVNNFTGQYLQICEVYTTSETLSSLGDDIVYHVWQIATNLMVVDKWDIIGQETLMKAQCAISFPTPSSDHSAGEDQPLSRFVKEDLVSSIADHWRRQDAGTTMRIVGRLSGSASNTVEQINAGGSNPQSTGKSGWIFNQGRTGTFVEEPRFDRAVVDKFMEDQLRTFAKMVEDL